MRKLVTQVLIASSLLWLAGCVGPLLKRPVMDTVAEIPNEPESLLIGDIAQPYGMNYVQVESVGLVLGLAGTGEDPAPTPQRAALYAEMQRREVDDPAKILSSHDTAPVLVRGFLRPGIQEGDSFDVEVQVPSRGETTSLRNGWLLSTRMAPLAVMGNRIHNGHTLAIAEGPILVDPTADSADSALSTRGRVLGGGKATKCRSLGLLIDNGHRSVRTSSQIGVAINRRFHTFIRGSQEGMATPKTENFVELLVHPRYKDNVARYMRVVRNIAIHESPFTQDPRLALLESQLNDPMTSATAAIRLEANGSDESREILKRALSQDDAEVRFYAAEALAYLDETSAAEPLAETARNSPAFRLNALAALSAMDDPLARDALRGLLAVKSAETRYGAFRALWAMDPNDPMICGDDLDGRCSLHIVHVNGPKMIHATRSFRPEIVLFGEDHHFRLPLMVEAGRNIMVNGLPDGTVTVSRFAVGESTQKRVVSTRVDEVLGAIVELGGTYPDMVQALQEAKDSGALESRFRVDALPEPGRTYERSSESVGLDRQPAGEDGQFEESGEAEGTGQLTRQRCPTTPQPDLFSS
ncbi:MAG: flagellar basal body P-ring protein FlgI [Pirellulales bacterium]|nr:flagellar basal body P-ring protein FlgI [Pirellulales bacterium]